MANAIYPLWKDALMKDTWGVDLSAAGTNIKVTLVDGADYTYSAAHDFYDDVPGAARVATSGNLANKTVSSGVFDADDITFTAVTGDQSEILIIWRDTTVESTSNLMVYLDTSITGLPVTPSGGNINVVWDSGANKIFVL